VCWERRRRYRVTKEEERPPGEPVMGREAELLGRRENFHVKIKLGCQGFWAEVKNWTG
jgi:hypothetical protein